MKTRVVVFESPGCVALHETQVHEPGPGQLLVRNTFSVVSPGTEARVLAGRQAGMQFPLVPGYSAAGVVEAVGEGVDLAEGTAVVRSGGGGFGDLATQWGGHAQHAIVSADAVAAMPEGLEPRHAACHKLAAIAYRGFRHAAPQPDERVLVLGLGMIGQLSARWFTGACQLTVADLDPGRVELARREGIDAIVVDRELQPLVSGLSDSFDVIVDATGASAVLGPAMSLLKARPWNSDAPPPRYVLQGSYAGDLCLPYQPAFMKEAQFILPRDNSTGDRDAALAALATGRLAVDDLLFAAHSPDQAADAYRSLATTAGPPTVVFQW